MNQDNKNLILGVEPSNTNSYWSSREPTIEEFYAPLFKEPAYSAVQEWCEGEAPRTVEEAIASEDVNAGEIICEMFPTVINVEFSVVTGMAGSCGYSVYKVGDSLYASIEVDILGPFGTWQEAAESLEFSGGGPYDYVRVQSRDIPELEFGEFLNSFEEDYPGGFAHELNAETGESTWLWRMDPEELARHLKPRRHPTVPLPEDHPLNGTATVIFLTKAQMLGMRAKAEAEKAAQSDPTRPKTEG